MDYRSSGSKYMKSGSYGAKILVAEDDKLLRLMIARLLQASGYNVHTCGNGNQALGLIGKEFFDLVITDMMMPGATGMEVLRETRRSQPRTKVIIITGTPSSEILLEAKQQGAYAYLRKPFQLRHFLSAVEDAIEHSRLRYGHEYARSLRKENRNAEREI